VATLVQDVAACVHGCVHVWHDISWVHGAQQPDPEEEEEEDPAAAEPMNGRPPQQANRHNTAAHSPAVMRLMHGGIQ